MPCPSPLDHLSGQPLISEFLFYFSHEKTFIHSGNTETLACSVARSQHSTKPHTLPELKSTQFSQCFNSVIKAEAMALPHPRICHVIRKL